MMLAILFFFVQQPCENCAGNSSSIDSAALAQFDGLSQAVQSLEQQVDTLAKERNAPWWSKETLKPDLQDAVIDLSDSMTDNALLTRAYLALAVAQLKLMQASDVVHRLSEVDRTKMLRHIEAIQLAINDRMLDSSDLRVFRVLTAGVRQELRKELDRMALKRSAPQYSPAPSQFVPSQYSQGQYPSRQYAPSHFSPGQNSPRQYSSRHYVPGQCPSSQDFSTRTYRSSRHVECNWNFPTTSTRILSIQTACDRRFLPN